LPNILSVAKLPRELSAPVASPESAFVAKGANLVPREKRDDQRLRPCGTAFLICVFEILRSDLYPLTLPS